MKKNIATLISIFALMACTIPSYAFNSLEKKKLEKMVKAMTLEQKARMLVGVWEEGAPSNIISSAGRTHAIEEMGVPSIVMNDGASGLRIDTLMAGHLDRRYYCTGFPVATLLASTWNDDMLRKVGETIASEMNHYGTDLLLAPSLNIQRNPLCGRNFEYLSEDPYLAGHSAAQLVKGLQDAGAGATIKHFAANNQQTARVNNDARVSQRALREIYLRAFEIAIKEGQPWAVMTALNKINGTRACGSAPLLTGVLREEWGWEGLVMTDWFQPENTAEAVHAGNDLLMGGCRQQVEDIIEGVRNGSISMADVDRNVLNVLCLVTRTWTWAGHEPDLEPDLGNDAKVALEAAQEGIVLLKNDGKTLPLAAEEDIAVFGVGSYLFYANGLGCADVNKPYTVNLLQGMKEAGLRINPVVDEFYQKYFKAQDVLLRETNTKTWKNWFFGYKVPEEAELPSFFIEKRAVDCSKAIITIARNCGEALDRDYVEGQYLLTRTEKDMIARVCKDFHARDKKVVLIVNTGAPIELSPVKDEVDAIVLAWQPGQEGGRAVVSVLDGSVNPSGKLPVTWENNWEDIPSSKNFPTHYTFNWDDVKPFGRQSLLETRNLGYTEYEEDIWVGYRYFSTFSKPVAFPFGFGLSYTVFDWTDAKITRHTKDEVTVSINIRNAGDMAGKEVVQLYSSIELNGFETPVRELRAYCKTRLLEPGESQTVSLTVRLADLASFHEDSMSWITSQGVYALDLCGNVDDVRASLNLEVSKPIVRKVSYRP